MEKELFTNLLGSGIAGAMLGPYLEPLGFLDRGRNFLPVDLDAAFAGIDRRPVSGRFRPNGKRRDRGRPPAGVQQQPALLNCPVLPKARLLERMIPLAHASGLQVHAWIWCMPCNNPSVIQHPDWFA
ncbi:MAG: hypothetical protein IPN20_03720 [Haliscomenobacter sp.]|nr:hypothetical protein [Haliscomenobacter sp.]